MATPNPLRKAVADKYGGNISTETPAGASSAPKINPVRATVAQKYAAPAVEQPSVNRVALTPVNNINPAPPIPEPAKQVSLRDQMAAKYSEAKPTPVDNAKKNGIIASPEYFARSVDVRNSSGAFVGTYSGKKDGEAEAKARAAADKIGGTVVVTPPLGPLGKIYTRVKEAFTGAIDNFAQTATDSTYKLLSVKQDPNSSIEKYVPDENAGPVSRGAAITNTGVAAINVLLAPIGAAFAGAEETPGLKTAARSVDYLFGKVGEGAKWGSDKVVDNLPVDQATKDEIRPAVENLSVLLAQLAAAKVAGVSTKVLADRTETIRNDLKTKITKNVIETNNLPRSVYIEPAKIKSIFQTGDKISPEELQMVKDLGLTSTEYRAAIQDGVTIKIPAENISRIVDKPWFARVKSAFRITPTDVTEVSRAGKATKGPELRQERLLETPGEKTPVPEANVQPDAPQEVQDAFTKPVTSSLLAKIDAFTPELGSAFGKKIVDSINESVGTKLTGSGIPEGNIDVIEASSGDGRPAQFKNGRIQVFLPDLIGDIKQLAEGKQILAHEGEFSTVYKKTPGESIEDLARRYVRDIILHEAGHQKTMTIEDATGATALNSALNAAKLEGKPAEVTAARQALEKHMRGLEDKANAHVRANKAALEKEFLGGPIRKTSTDLQRQVNKNAGGGIDARKKVVVSEKKTLTERVKAIAKGARIGFTEGKKVGAKEAKSETSTRYDAAIEKIRDRASTVASRKAAAIDYASILPFRERGKFLRAINNISSQKEFLDVMVRMSNASKATERAGMIKQISAELKETIIKKKGGFPNVKFELEAQRALNEIRAVQKLSYAEAQIQIADTVSEWQTAHPDESLPDEVLRKIEILKTAGIKEQTVAELANTLSIIQDLKETGRTKKELEKFNRDTEIQQAKDKVFDTITGGKKLPSDELSLKARPKQSFLKSTKEFFTNHQYGLEEVLDVLSENDKTSAAYKSFLSRDVGDRVSDAYNEQNQGELKTIDKVNDAVKKTYGVETNKQVLQVLGEMKEPHDLGSFKHTDGTTKKLVISRGEAVQMHMWMQDPTLESTFTEGLGWTPEIKRAVEGLLTEKDKQVSDALLDFYRTYYDTINKVFSKEYGIDLPFNENYSPVHRDIDVAIPENVLLAQEAAKYATAKNGSLKDRVKNQIDLKPTDAFENLVRHIAKMEHYKAWSDPMYRFRKIFGDKQVRQAITDFHGESYMKIMDGYLNDFARDGVSREKVIRAVDTIRANATKALLGLNLKVGVKQLSGVLNYGIEIPTKDFLPGLADFWLDPIGHAKFLHDNSPALQERFGDGFERDLKYAIQKGYDKKLAKTNKLSEAMFIPIRNADRLTVYMGSWAAYRSAYKEAIAAGKSEEVAQDLGIRNAENVTNRTQESSRPDTLTDIQRGGSLAKLFTMFQSQPTKYIRVMMNAGRNYRAGRQGAGTAMKRIAWAWIVAPFFYNLIADQFIDKKYREQSGGLVLRTLLGPLTEPLIVGQMVQQLYGWASGNDFGYQASPVEAFMNDLQKAVAQFQSDDVVDGTTYILDTIGKLTGVPTGIVTGPIRAANKK